MYEHEKTSIDINKDKFGRKKTLSYTVTSLLHFVFVTLEFGVLTKDTV